MNANTVLRLLSGGAAQGLVRQLQPGFEAKHGLRIEGGFGAVGAMKDRLLAGEACDLVILTRALIDELAGAGHVVRETVRDIGVVRTGVALQAGAAAQPVDSPEALQRLFAQAPEIYFPDPAKATAGIHFMKVLQGLGLADTLKSRLRTFPNGATAMGELARAASGAVGCTQVTEILYTPGVQLVGLLPPPYELATTYTAGVCTRAQQPQAAAALIAELARREAEALRKAGGFDPVG